MRFKSFVTGLMAGLCLFVWKDALAFENLPKDAPKDIKHIIGLYFGNGENLLIRENQGRLELLYKTKQEDVSFNDATVFPLTKDYFDSYTLLESGPLRIQDATLKFERDSDGYGISLRLGGKLYTRRFLGETLGEKPSGFSIKSHTEDEWQQMRKQALEANMPMTLQSGEKAEIVPVSSIPDIKEVNVYSTADNLFKVSLYDNEKMYVGKDCAEALSKVNQRLKPYGMALVLWDAYRPWYISKLANLALPADAKGMLSDPDKEGSSHNTGNAVDVSLYDLQTGELMEMISSFDEPSIRQYASYAGGTTRQRFLKELLRREMKLAGFKGIEMEWWHFEFMPQRNWAKLNIKF